MSLTEKAAATLREAEETLRKLVVEAATSGSYTEIVKIAEWAKAIGGLLRQSSSVLNRGLAQIREARDGERPHASRRSVSRSASRSAYPRFYRAGKQLVRVAWSKRERKEYRQSASEEVLQSLSKVIGEAGKDGHVFSTDQILPIRNKGETREIPNYQSYVCLAWLKNSGLIDQHGRQGYSVPKAESFQKSVDSLWQGLPKE